MKNSIINFFRLCIVKIQHHFAIFYLIKNTLGPQPDINQINKTIHNYITTGHAIILHNTTKMIDRDQHQLMTVIQF